MRKTRAALKSLINRRGKKMKKGGGRQRRLLKTIIIDGNIQKGTPLSLCFFFPLQVSGQVGIFDLHLCFVTSAELIRGLERSTLRKCQALMYPENGIYPSLPVLDSQDTWPNIWFLVLQHTLLQALKLPPLSSVLLLKEREKIELC